jgi:hypothetical protein
MADWKITDPLINAVISAGGALGNVLPNSGMFTPVKTLNDTLKGNQSTITEKDLTAEQLKFIKDIVAFKEKYAAEHKGASGVHPGAITYQDYQLYAKTLPEDQSPMSKTPGLFSVFDPYGQMQTTLGQFGYKIDPKTGAVSVSDKYNFNPLYNVNGSAAMETAYGPYGAVREYAGRQIPEGTGRPVNINISGLEPSIK